MTRVRVASATLTFAIAVTSFVAGAASNALYREVAGRRLATTQANAARPIGTATTAGSSGVNPVTPPPPVSAPARRSAASRPDRTPSATTTEPARRTTSDGAADVTHRREIVVSLERRRLWLVDGRDTVLSSPIAVGRGETFTYEGKVYRFETPRGRLRILSKINDPMWVPPDWHYYEKAVARGLEVVRLAANDSVPLSDGSAIVVRHGNVGRLNRRGQYWPWTPGMEIMIDGKIFIPPPHSPQRRVPDALGPYKLGLGNGIYIHGTNPYDSTSIGTAASHGCIRMPNDLLKRLYDSVGVGTPVLVR